MLGLQTAADPCPIHVTAGICLTSGLCKLIFKIIYLKDGQSQVSYLYWLTSHMSVTARTGPGSNQEPKGPPVSPC